MYIIYNSDFLITEQTETPRDFAYYVAQSLSVSEIDSDKNCVGLLFVSGLLIAAPTPYHTAKRGNWILTEENALLLSQVVTTVCEKIMADCLFGASGNFYEQISSINLFTNKAKAYSLLKRLSQQHPQIILE